MRTTFLALHGLLLLALLALAAGCASSRPLALDLTPEELNQKLGEDLELIARYDKGLAQTLGYARANPELFPKKTGVVALNPDEKRELQMVWRQTLDYLFALDGIKTFWERYQTHTLFTRRPVAHSKAYLASYAAWVTQYYHGLVFMRLTVPSRPMETMLDESVPELGIPSGAFARLKLSVIHVQALWQLMAGREYLRALTPKLEKESAVGSVDYEATLSNLLPYVQESRRMVGEHGLVQYAYNAFDITRDVSFKAWFPLQKGVAMWMGDTKVARLHRHLISHAQLDAMRERMEPGDIVVARHNWYLSNIGLPGFWPHAELYLGSPEELGTYFDADPEIRNAIRTHTGLDTTFTEMLAQRYPDAWTAYTAQAADGEPHRIIEAISEGVVFSSLYKGAGADYVGVMRPRHGKVAKAWAIVEGFKHHGRAYDFNFDFLSDTTLVCTELVYKSWQSGDSKPGVDFPLEKIVGRTTLSANSVVRYFDETYNRGEQRPLDFVYFLDGREKEKAAVVAGVEAFRASWRRPKWDVVQK